MEEKQTPDFRSHARELNFDKAKNVATPWMTHKSSKREMQIAGSESNYNCTSYGLLKSGSSASKMESSTIIQPPQPWDL